MFSTHWFKMFALVCFFVIGGLNYLPAHFRKKLQISPSVKLKAPSAGSSNANVIDGAGILWIEATSWSEGLAGWSVTMSEAIAIAQRLNGKVVEPCIRKGRLGTCGGNNTLKFGQIFDVSFARKWLVSQEDFDLLRLRAHQSLEVIPAFGMCMSPRGQCKNKTNYYRSMRSASMENAVAAAKTQPHGAVLQIGGWRKYAFQRMTFNGTQLLDYGGTVKPIQKKLMLFKKEHRDQVAWMLREMGVSRTFNVIHWRAEIPHIDYLECAHHILRAANTMGSGNTTTVIMSSLNLHEDLQWGGAKRRAKNTTASRALQLLLDSGMKKLDSVLTHVNITDMIQTVIWDVILAMKAQKFATCSNGCSTVCANCSHGGWFSALVREVRQDQENKSSSQCWPS